MTLEVVSPPLEASEHRRLDSEGKEKKGQSVRSGYSSNVCTVQYV